MIWNYLGPYGTYFLSKSPEKSFRPKSSPENGIFDHMSSSSNRTKRRASICIGGPFYANALHPFEERPNFEYRRQSKARGKVYVLSTDLIILWMNLFEYWCNSEIFPEIYLKIEEAMAIFVSDYRKLFKKWSKWSMSKSVKVQVFSEAPFWLPISERIQSFHSPTL